MLKKIFTPKTIVIIFITALITLAALFFFKYRETQNELNKLKSGQSPATQAFKEETQKIMSEVGKLVVLPKDETPTIATVTDADKLKTTQVFFANAKNGDKVLIYSKKAILYDPVAKKIIDIAPINVVSPSPSSLSNLGTVGNLSPTPPITPKTPISPTTLISPIKFYLLNSTSVTGLTRKYEPLLKQSLPGVTVIGRGDAKNDYTKSILILINESKAKEVEQISKALNLPLEKLPEGEDKPKDTDFLIILGSDKTNL